MAAWQLQSPGSAEEILEATPVRAGMVKRVRGVAYGMRVAPAVTNRMVDGARGVLNNLLADVYIFTDHMSGAEAGASPGFGLALVAETTTGLLLGAQAASPPAVRAQLCTCPSLFPGLLQLDVYPGKYISLKPSTLKCQRVIERELLLQPSVMWHGA